MTNKQIQETSGGFYLLVVFRNWNLVAYKKIWINAKNIIQKSE